MNSYGVDLMGRRRLRRSGVQGGPKPKLARGLQWVHIPTRGRWPGLGLRVAAETLVDHGAIHVVD